MTLADQMRDLGQRARAAARVLAGLTSERKNAALIAIAAEIAQQSPVILAANARDVAAAENSGLATAMVDRLTLNPERIESMANAIRQAASLPDPVGEVIREWTRPNGIRISKVRVPIGVVGMIYESRPNVTSDAAALCLKTGNAVILRGGSEASRSNAAIAAALQAGCAKANLPNDSILLVANTDREAVRLMAEMDEYIDVIVPRGGEELINHVVQHARMPVIKHSHGICAIYVDCDADFAMAERIVVNAKVQRPGVCNAAETLLLHREIASRFLERFAPAGAKNQVELRADETAHSGLTSLRYPFLKRAVAQDWKTEFLDLVLAVRVVDDLDAAIAHIDANGSNHSDCIVTEDAAAAEKFLKAVDSAAVYWNASTRFTDGSEFGFGAEMGISTAKVGVRGPMGLEELTTYKYLIRGDGQIRT